MDIHGSNMMVSKKLKINGLLISDSSTKHHAKQDNQTGKALRLWI